MSRPLRNKTFQFVTLLLGLWFAWDLISHLVAEVLWFKEVGYLSAFLKRLQTQIGVWVVVCTTSAVFLLGNLFLANQLKYSDSSLLAKIAPEELSVSRQGLARINLQLQRETQPIRVGTGNSLREEVQKSSLGLNLRSLLVVVFFLSLLVGVMLLHYGKIAVSLWHSDVRLLNVTPPLPTPFNWSSVQALVQQPQTTQIWQLGVLVAIAIGLIVKTRFGLSAIASVLSVFFAFVLSAQWGRILLYFHPIAFNAKEPLFGRDISFYIFSFPVWQLLDFWLRGLFLFGLVAVLLVYLLAGNSFSHGKFPGFSQSQLRHLYGLVAGMAAVVAVRYWLSRYELLYSTRGVTYGASYT
ncbi:MAG: UPF0182 family protein, partial [Coleofasciculus sp. Co-bin14]|nr:UPF0182 family protein [Coleofasciculus sp. Co-bin14]